MSKRTSRRRNQQAPRSFPLLALVIAGALVLLIGGGLAVWNSSRARPAAEPQVSGAPKLAVNHTTVDEGYVQFNVPVRTSFRLSNVGDQPLKILGQPQVELIEGC
jgi:hypothetical protein